MLCNGLAGPNNDGVLYDERRPVLRGMGYVGGDLVLARSQLSSCGASRTTRHQVDQSMISARLKGVPGRAKRLGIKTTKKIETSNRSGIEGRLTLPFVASGMFESERERKTK